MHRQPAQLQLGVTCVVLTAEEVTELQPIALPLHCKQQQQQQQQHQAPKGRTLDSLRCPKGIENRHSLTVSASRPEWMQFPSAQRCMRRLVVLSVT